MIRQSREFFRIPTRNDIEPGALPDWLRELNLKAMAVDWSSISLHEKEWMKRWDETVKGRGKRLHGE
jgi:iron(III) transport system substrate-binding protein